MMVGIQFGGKFEIRLNLAKYKMASPQRPKLYPVKIVRAISYSPQQLKFLTKFKHFCFLVNNFEQRLNRINIKILCSILQYLAMLYFVSMAKIQNADSNGRC